MFTTERRSYLNVTGTHLHSFTASMGTIAPLSPFRYGAVNWAAFCRANTGLVRVWTVFATMNRLFYYVPFSGTFAAFTAFRAVAPRAP
jgi:hypothetical protein